MTNRYKSWLRALKAWLSSGREPSCCRPRGRRGSRQPFLEILEDRLAPATLTPLVSATDGSVDSLRYDINLANTNGDPANTLNLASGGAGTAGGPDRKSVV